MKAKFAFVLLLVSILGWSPTLSTKNWKPFWYAPAGRNKVPVFFHEDQQQGPRQIQAIEDNVAFWHHLPGEDEGRLVTPDCDNCTSQFIKGAPLIISAHGFADSHTGSLGRRLRESLANRQEPMNIILIDYSKIAVSPHYVYAVNNLHKVGEYTAKLVNFLVDQEIISVDHVHFVGHSLGAHIANYISPNINGGQLQRVYGLDPAMPLFNLVDDSKRLSEHDGAFVIVLHTSTTFQGINKDCGHADFYVTNLIEPNAGKHQPGCDDNMFGDCSHARVVALFAESITSPNAFQSCRCPSWQEFDEGACSCDQPVSMGWDTPSLTRGTFYLKTSGDSPYSVPLDA